MKRSLLTAFATIFLFFPACLLGASPPDSFGYSFTTSTEGGPVYAFKDISATGASIPLSIGGPDDGAGTATLGAPFVFYGETLTQLRMSTNGYLSTDLTDEGQDTSNSNALPQNPDLGGGARIYALHDDLLMVFGAMHYEYFPEGIESPMFTGGFPFRPRIGVSVFQWTDARHLGNDSSFSFQALLFDDGSIYFAYDGRNPETGSGSTTGIQNEDATIGLTIAANTSGSIPGNSAVSITPPHTIVTNMADEGPGSLRQAILDSPSPGLITFDPTVFNKEDEKTILLTSGQLSISGKTLAIEGNDVCGVTLNAGGLSRVFDITNNSIFVLDSLKITGGRALGAAGINNRGNSRMTLLNSAVHRNEGEQSAGGVANAGTLRMENCTVYDNGAGRVGTSPEPHFDAGVRNLGGELIIRNSTIVRNESTGFGGGVSSSGQGGTIRMSGSVVANNIAPNPDVSDFGDIISEGRNFIRDNTGSSGAFPSNGLSANVNGDFVGTAANPLEPMFAGDGDSNRTALVNNGGPTLTLMPLPGSPLIDKGIASTLPDQRGVLPVGNRDIGAVETTWGEGVSTGTPAEFDVTTPGDPVTIFPKGSRFYFTQSVSLGPDKAIDNSNTPILDDDFAQNDTFNGGLTVTPRLGVSQLTGISISSTNYPTEDPACFLLLGSNDANCFTPIASAAIPIFPATNTTQSFEFSNIAAVYRHYRIIIPQNRGSAAFISIGQIALHGTLLNPPGETPRIMNFQVTPSADNAAENDVSITFTSQPGTSYDIQAGTMLDDFTDIKGTIPDAGEYTTTTVSSYEAAAKAFFRVYPHAQD